jgi:hypothetical protein
MAGEALTPQDKERAKLIQEIREDIESLRADGLSRIADTLARMLRLVELVENKFRN